MTRGQKHILSAAPVAALIVAGAIWQPWGRFNQEEEDEPPRPHMAAPNPKDFERFRASADVHVLAELERQLESQEEFVRKVEAIRAELQPGRHVELKKKLDGQIASVVNALGNHLTRLRDFRGDELPEVDKARLASVASKLTDLVNRLARCRAADHAVPPPSK